MMREAFLIVDGNSLLHRAYHALPPMDVDGVYTNAVHGFLSMLLRVMQEENPQYCAVAFDEHAPTFRHTVYAEYKAGRMKTPDELVMQFPIIEEVLQAMGLGVISLTGYEADDLLGTMSAICRKKEIQAILLTGDRDALQLVDDTTKLIFTRKGISEAIHFTPAMVKETYGVTPEQVTDWKGLMGDSSDNIPGVPGVGDKTAVKLLSEYGTLENVLAHDAEIKGKLGEKIRENEEQAKFSKMLATIRTDAPIEIPFDSWKTNHMAGGMAVLQKYHLKAIADRLSKMTQSAASEPEETEEAADAAFLPFEEIASKEDLARFVAFCQGKETALHVTESTMTLACENRRIKIVTAQDLLSAGMMPGDAWQEVQKLFYAGLIVHNGKKLCHTAASQGLPRPVILWDTMLGAYLHNPQEKSYALMQFTQDEDASGVMTLYKTQKRQIAKENMQSLYDEIELPLMNVLYDMEREGFRVDAKVLRELGDMLTKKAEELKETIYQLTGQHGFNINSTQQLGKILFEEMGLRSGRKTKLGYSTDADTLEAIADEHPVIPAILQYRQVVKLNSTYIDALIRKMDATGRIHSYFDQTGTATGRISSSEPNLQNIPVRTELGREVRRAFVAGEGNVLVDADYSQIELRILAHISGDAAMCDAFNRRQDIHTRTAAEVNGVAMEEVTPAMRSGAKAVNFGIVYGISDFGLARNIGISRAEAADFIARYFDRYPKVKEFMNRTVQEGMEKGYAETLFGRRRQLTELKSSNGNMRKFGERVAMNTPIQGTAADIIKLAMVRVHDALEKGNFKAKLILQVHDELLIEAPENEKEQVAALLKDCMENVITLSVPLTVEVKTGKSWYETK